MFYKKNVLLGVTGGIAAYKIPNLASMLKKQGLNVRVMMTPHAAEFITPATFEALTGNRCLTDTFERTQPPEIHHISWAKEADCVLIAPASADAIGKIASGIADDIVTSTLLACQCPVYIAPAMNTRMFENPIVQDNIEKLRHYGYHIITPNAGYLACGDTGAGKMPEPDELYAYLEREMACEKDLAGLNILVTAGATQEALDPVRYLTNHSSGKMGYAVAKAAALRGAQVTLISGKTNLTPPLGVHCIFITSAKEMFEEVKKLYREQDIIVKAAAVADYTPSSVSEEKIKKSDGELTLSLKRTDDILQYLGEHRQKGQILCGFSMETEHMLENARAKLRKKNLDLIAANNVKVEGAGFQRDTNVLTLITDMQETKLPLMSKEEAAHCLLDAALHLYRQKC